MDMKFSWRGQLQTQILFLKRHLHLSCLEVSTACQAKLPASINVTAAAGWTIADNFSESGAYVTDKEGHVHLNCANLFPDAAVSNYDCLVLAALHKYRLGELEAGQDTATPEQPSFEGAAPLAIEGEPAASDIVAAVAEPGEFLTPDQKKRKVVGQRKAPPGNPACTKAAEPPVALAEEPTC